jgi:DNA modification methylase
VSVRLLTGDCRAILPTLPPGSVHCVVTSPPYWGLRDYGTATWEGGDASCAHLNGQLVSNRSSLRLDGRAHLGPYEGEKAVTAGMPYRDTCGKCGTRRIDQQLGLEATPEEYIADMVGVFRDVRRVLRADGTLWLNMGDSYASDTKGSGGISHSASFHATAESGRTAGGVVAAQRFEPRRVLHGLKQKDLVGMPWRLAFALQADGWYLRSDIIWAKPNPMPESVTDRPTKAHEYVFLLTKSARYFYDADAVREPPVYATAGTTRGTQRERNVGGRLDGYTTLRIPGGIGCPHEAGRNLRTVWTIPSEPYPEAHFATFPPELALRCILAGTSAKGCCAECGAPWDRVRERVPAAVANKSYGAATAGAVGRHRGSPERPGGFVGASVTTTGWAPTCIHTAFLEECGIPPVPATVLDPFAGSGTVGEVAEHNGRHSILIELSPAYVQLAKDRTAQLGLFAQSARAERAKASALDDTQG